MLTAGIAGSWNDGAEALGAAPNVTVVGQGTPGPTENAPAPTIFGTGIADFVGNHVLHAEIFGAASLVIRYSTAAELIEATYRLEGQLTASLQLTEEDYPTAAQLLPALEQKVGRIIVNGWPTGVEVGHAMVHGGPFPRRRTPARRRWAPWRSTASCGRSRTRTCPRNCSPLRCRMRTRGTLTAG